MAVSFPWMLVGIALLLVFLGNVVWTGRKEKPPAKGKQEETSFRTLFYVGICWMAVGLPLGYSVGQPAYFAFFAMGIFFSIMGLAMKGKWKNEKKWHQLAPETRKFRLMIMAAALLLVVAGAFAATAYGA
ncbi:MAG: hypothetical protein WCT52_02620 [Candidatus Micrarchaeia archaeon]|jgi:hypothetical protein